MTTPAAHLTRALVHARQRAGITTQQLATTMGVTRQAVSAWENSDGGVHLGTLTAWAGALGYRLQLAPTAGPGHLVDATGGVVTCAPPANGPHHWVLTGPGRLDVAAALLREYPADLVVLTPDTSLHLPGATRQHVSVLRSAPKTGAAVITVPVALADGPRECIEDLVRTARSTGRCILLLAANVEDLPSSWVSAAYRRVHADQTITVTAADGTLTTWTLH